MLGSKRADASGNSVEKIDPKSRFTFAYVVASVSFFFTFTFSIWLLSFSMISRFFSSSSYSLSAFSIIPNTFLFRRRPNCSCSSSNATTRLCTSSIFTRLKS